MLRVLGLLIAAALPGATARAETVVVPAASATPTLAFAATITGQPAASAGGAPTVGGLSLRNNVGTIEIAGATLPAVLSQKIPWPEYQLTLYQGLAVTADDLLVFWLYCDTASKLTSIYVEGASALPLTQVDLTGTCAERDAATPTATTLPGVSFALPPPVGAFDVTGPAVAIAPHAAGTLKLDDTYAFWPFSVVDCTACLPGGWYELHGLLLRQGSSEVTFSIVYLKQTGDTRVELAHSFRFPDAADPFGSAPLTGHWSKADLTGLRTAQRLTRPILPPPAL